MNKQWLKILIVIDYCPDPGPNLDVPAIGLHWIEKQLARGQGIGQGIEKHWEFSTSAFRLPCWIWFLLVP